MTPHYVTWYEVLTKGCLIALVAALTVYLILELCNAYHETFDQGRDVRRTRGGPPR